MSVLAGLAAVALLAWGYLWLGHGGFWRTGPNLPSGATPASGWPDVVAVVPARDEAAMLPQTLPSLLGQDYPGSLRVVLVDDGSTDGTAEVARRCAGGLAREPVVPAGSAPPPGWAGKVWAMDQGLDAAGESTYVLFTDADIVHRPDTVTALVRAAEHDRRDAVSLMALLRVRSGWERALVPAFVYFFAQLYPFRRVGDPGARTAAAAGGCVLVRRAALESAGGLGEMRGALIDDVALGRLIKHRPGGGRTWLGFSLGGVLSCRAYPRLADLWHMIARSAYTQLRHSPWLLLATVAGLLWLYAVPPAATVAGAVFAGGGLQAALALAAGCTAWTIMTATYVPVLRLYGLSALRAPGLPLVALLYAAITVDSAWRHYSGRGGAWKGRVAAPGSG